MSPKIKNAKRAKRVRELRSYMENNASAVRLPRPSLGTMEATTAHAGAARLKGQGRSWSRAGAEAMCPVRCALATGRDLVVHPKDALFTRAKCERTIQGLAKDARQIRGVSGKGYEPPHQASTHAMKSAA